MIRSTTFLTMMRWWWWWWCGSLSSFFLVFVRWFAGGLGLVSTALYAQLVLVYCGPIEFAYLLHLWDMVYTSTNTLMQTSAPPTLISTFFRF